jgi:hypothetical protein
MLGAGRICERFLRQPADFFRSTNMGAKMGTTTAAVPSLFLFCGPQPGACAPIDYGRTAALAALLSALVLTYLCCHPVFAFVRRGWRIKKEDIFSSLNSSAKQCYIKTFNIDPGPDADAAFDRMYEFRYGRYRLTVPVILLIIVVFPLLYLEVSSGLGWLIVENARSSKPVWLLATPGEPLLALPAIAVAAVAGAYVWTVANLIDGAVRYNLPPQTVVGAALRLAVSIPLGYAVQSIAAASIGPFIAFAIGAFPLGEVQVILKRIATLKLGLEAGPDHQKDEVHMLDGVDQPTAERLADGDVLTIPQLAYCDPVQLSMRTNLSFTSIIDAQSQALAWIYLGDNLPQLSKIGFRGAIEISHYANRLNQEKKKDGPLHELLNVASARTGVSPPDQSPRLPIDPAGLKHAFEEIGGDPYTEFLCAVWATSGQPVVQSKPRAIAHAGP